MKLIWSSFKNLASSLGDGVVYAFKTGAADYDATRKDFCCGHWALVFSTMTDNVAKGEMGAYKQNLTMGLRMILFLLLYQLRWVLMVLSHPMTRAMYQQFENNFSTRCSWFR